jgi:ribosome-binding protein aMBF1 (putative translation factor)
MNKCSQCNRSEEEVRLFDGIYGLEDVRICEKCSLLNNIPIIKRPSSEQLKASERGSGVRERLVHLAGLSHEEKKERTISEEINELEKNPELEKPEELVFKLVDNFKWEIMTARRRKMLSIKQLAEQLSESESALTMLEKGIVPGDSLSLLEKLEQFFNIKLIKKDYFEKIEEEARIESMKPREELIIRKTLVLEKPEKNPLGIGEREKMMMREEANDMIKVAIKEEKSFLAKSKEEINGTVLRIEDFRKDKIDGIRIADLKRTSDLISRDFNIERLKGRDEVGKEQFEGFGKEDTGKIMKQIIKDSGAGYSREDASTKLAKSKTPTIYDLMKTKEEKDKTSIIGKDIQLEDKEKNKVEKIFEFDM